MMDNHTYYISKNGNSFQLINIPIKWQSGTVNYWYPNRNELPVELTNRWRILKYCGKKFIVNEGNESEMEVTPNDIYLAPKGVAWNRIALMSLLVYALFFLFWIIGLFFPFWSMGFWESLIAATVSTLLFFIVGGCMWLNGFEYKREAKEFNSEIIPEEKLI